MATCILSSAHICKKRSNRELVCSGPCPSWPWGSNNVKPDILSHFLSPVVMNWSMIVCAPLEKSPNCASQITNVFGSAWEYPYSKPRTPNSDKKLSTISNNPCFSLKWRRGTNLSSFSWSYKTAWRWLKVPLPTSWPDKRTPYPSARREANAKASAVAQSIFCSFTIDWYRSLYIFFIRLCGVNSSGIECISFAINLISSSLEDVLPRRASKEAVLKPVHVPSNQSALFGLYDFDNSNSLSRNFLKSEIRSLASSSVNTSSRTSWSLYILRVVACFFIFLYIKGCVNIGSSASLCPERL